MRKANGFPFQKTRSGICKFPFQEHFFRFKNYSKVFNERTRKIWSNKELYTISDN